MTDRQPPDDTPGTDEEKWPVGFLLILVLAALYLGWRLIQGVLWVIGRF